LLAPHKLKTASGPPQPIEEQLNGSSSSVKTAPFDVAMGFRIYSISSVDPVRGTAVVDFRLFAEWKDPTLMGSPETDKCDDFWVPFFILTCLTSEDIDGGCRLMDSKTGAMKWHKRYKAEVAVDFKLHDFPFDSHKIEIEVRIPRELDRKRIGDVFPDPERTTGANCINEFSLDEWLVFQPTSLVAYVKKKPHFLIRTRIARQSFYYVINVLLILFLITLMCPIAAIMHPDEVDARSNHILQLILTTVAFKFAIASVLPSTSYLTVTLTLTLTLTPNPNPNPIPNPNPNPSPNPNSKFVDKYLAACFCMIFAFEMETAIVGILARWGVDSMHLDVGDGAFCLAWIVVLLLAQAYFIHRARYRASAPAHEMLPVQWTPAIQ
jgi:hypothetical protein